MYNSKIKEDFISSKVIKSESKHLDVLDKAFQNLFNRTERFEKDFEKDILFLTLDELKSFLQKQLSGGKKYQNNTFAALKSYCEWGKNNNIITENLFDRITLEDIDISLSYENTMLKNEKELIELLDEILSPLENDTKDNIVRCIMLLVFTGIDFDDIWYLREEDFDINNKNVFYKAKTIQLSDEIFDIIKYYLSMSYLAIRGKGDSYYEQNIIREGFLISNTIQNENNREKIKRNYSVVISQLMAMLPKKLTPTIIRDSGVFYRMYLKEKETGIIDLKEYLFFRRNYTTTLDMPNRTKEICIYEYNIWKKAFN